MVPDFNKGLDFDVITQRGSCGPMVKDLEARLDEKLVQIHEQLAQLTAAVREVASLGVKDEIPATVPDDDLDSQCDEEETPKKETKDEAAASQWSLQCGGAKTELFDCSLREDQVGDIEISDDEAPDPEQERIAERVLAEEAPLADQEWNTQASQERLLRPENKTELAARFARSQMAELSGAQRALDPRELRTKSSSDLLEAIHKKLNAIPEEQLRTSSRKHVRPDGQDVSMQIPLGLVVSGTWHGIPMPGKATHQHLQLQQLIFSYVEVRAKEQGIDLNGFVFTSMHITKNLQTKRHLDQKNSGFSLIFTLGNHTGGELFIEDAEGCGSEDSKMIHVVRNTLVVFDGSRHWHGTMPFEGTRYAVVLYCMSRAYEKTPALTRAFLQEVGYRLPPAEFGDEITHELLELGRNAAAGEKVEDEPGRHKPPKGKRKADSRSPSDTQRGPSKRCAVESCQGPEAAGAAPAANAEWTAEQEQEFCNMKSKERRWSWKAISKKLGRSEEHLKAKWTEMNQARENVE